MKKLNSLLRNGTFSPSYVAELNKNSLANLFNVVCRGNKSYFNLCKGVSFSNLDKLSDESFSSYIVLESDSWPTISYKFYNTVELWWLICKFNNIKDPFEFPEAGTVIKIPSEQIKDLILDVIIAK